MCLKDKRMMIQVICQVDTGRAVQAWNNLPKAFKLEK
jgi:hypothetical protein